jgi:hypothetical protein
MAKILSKLIEQLINCIFFTIVLLFIFTFTCAFYQTLLNLNSWSELIAILESLQTKLPQLNSLSIPIY